MASKKKINYISTPTIKGQSNIEAVFLLGDQRYFNLPCPICHEYIPISWRTNVEGDEKNKAGIHFELDSHGELIAKSVGYICQKCAGFWKESNKYKIMNDGKWIPTRQPSEPGYYSYQISSLYAPAGMYNWTHYVRKFLECYPNGLKNSPDVEKLKALVNTCWGQTWEEKGKSLKIMQLATNTRSYQIDFIPEALSEQDGNGKIVMLVCSVDLNGYVDDARIDYEVQAVAETGSTYSVDAGSIGTFQRGQDKDIKKEVYNTYRNGHPGNVWDILLTQVMQKTYMSDTGKPWTIYIAGIDCGFFTQYAYTFVDQCQSLSVPLAVVGIKGDTEDGTKPKVRRIGIDNPMYKKSKEPHELYVVDVNMVKDYVAGTVELVWNEGMQMAQPPGFMNFPQPRDGKYLLRSYFSHFEAEHKVAFLNADGSKIGYYWDKRHSMVANHFWDVCVYNRVIREIFVELFCKASNIKVPSWGAYCELMKSII